MSGLVVGAVVIPISHSAQRPRMDWVDRARAFDGTGRASLIGNPKRDWHFITPPITRALADQYEVALGQVTAQDCSGDIIGGSQNLVLQSENFGTTWALSNTPTRTPAALVVGGITFDHLGDDAAGTVEGYTQNITYTGNATKAISLFVKQSSAASSVVRLVDNTAIANRLLAAITWSSGLPVQTMTTGTSLGYDTLSTGVFRLKFLSTSVTAANTNELDVFPATTSALAVADTGNLYVGGVQSEDAVTPTAYIKTTTATVNTLSVSCFTEITDWVPVPVLAGHYVQLSFVLHEA